MYVQYKIGKIVNIVYSLYTGYSEYILPRGNIHIPHK